MHFLSGFCQDTVTWVLQFPLVPLVSCLLQKGVAALAVWIVPWHIAVLGGDIVRPSYNLMRCVHTHYNCNILGTWGFVVGFERMS